MLVFLAATTYFDSVKSVTVSAITSSSETLRKLKISNDTLSSQYKKGARV